MEERRQLVPHFRQRALDLVDELQERRHQAIGNRPVRNAAHAP